MILNKNYMNLKKTILTFFLIQILAVAGNRVFAQGCEHWLKIVQTDKNNDGFFKISADDGREVQSIQIPPASDAVKVAADIARYIKPYGILTCFKRVGPYLCVDNVKRFTITNVVYPPGYKLVEVSRPNFISKIDTATITAYQKKHHAIREFKINSDTELYDGYIIEPIAYQPQVAPFGQPAEKITDWWTYKLTFLNNSFEIPYGLFAECSIKEYHVDHYITIRAGIKKLVLKE